MHNDAAGRARIARVFSGALDIWGVAGTVGPDPEDANAFVIASRTGPALHVSRDLRSGWMVTRSEPVSGAKVAIACHAGLPGLLRTLREALAPGSATGRLVIGAQHLLDPDGSAR